MMKTINTLLISFSFIFNLATIGQKNPSSSVWITINDPDFLATQVDGSISTSSEEFQTVIDKYSITNVKRALPNSRKENLQEVYEIQCDCEQDDLLIALQKLGSPFENAERAPNYSLLYTPNDYNLEFIPDYALDLINAKNAWDITKGDTSIQIAISDSNFDLTHEELDGTVSYMQPNSDPDMYHGTAVAITAAGNTDNNQGKSSIGSDCNLQLYKVGYDELLSATYNGARVINVSWESGCTYSSYEQEVIDEVYENGSIIVAAAGNADGCASASDYVYPASYNHVISVTSIGAWDNHELSIGDPSSTHQHNDSVDISAPGYDVPVTVMPGFYMNANGSSFAAPFVTGTIGLMLTVNPCLKFEDVEDILKSTSVNIDDLNPSYAGLIGAGRLDAGAAVETATNYTPLDLNTTVSYDCSYNAASVSTAIDPDEGQAPFTYLWNTGATSNVLSEIVDGVYSVQVTDANGCEGVDTVAVNIPDQITIEAEAINDFENDSASDIELTVSGGMPSYSYLWSNGETTEDLTDLEAGIYEVTVTDANYCSRSKSIEVLGPVASINTVQTNEIKLFPNPSMNGNTTLNWSGNTISNVAVRDISGKLIQNHAISEASNKQLNLQLPDGVYLVQLLEKDETVHVKKLIVQ